MSNESKEPRVRAFNLNITVKGPRDRIYISKDVIRALGVMSFKVPEKLFDSHKHEFTVHSKSFVHELIMANGLDTTKNYPLRGVCAQNGNAILFKMNVDLHGTGDL